MPTSAACSAGASLMPSPMIADDVAGLAQREDDALLLVRVDFGEHARVGRAGRQRLVADGCELGAGEDRRAARPTFRATRSATSDVVSGDDLERDAQTARAASVRGDVRLQRVVRTSSPRNVRCLSRPRVDDRDAHRPCSGPPRRGCGSPGRSRPGGASESRPRLRRSGRHADRPSPPPCKSPGVSTPPSSDERVRHRAREHAETLADEVVGDLVQLLQPAQIVKRR